VFKWLRIRNHSIFIGFLFSVLSYFLLPINYFGLITLFSIGVSLALIFKVQTLEKDKLTRNIDELGRTAEELLDELNLRYNVTKLVQEVGEITSVIQSEKEIASAVSKAMSRHLEYERGAILLAGKKKKNLHFTGGYGFTETEIALMNELRFSLYSQVKDSILQKVFEKQEPSLKVDIDKIISSMNLENAEVVKNLNLKSVICVPILHEGESLGVLLVDSSKSQQELSEGNINLLIAVAAQTALSIAHARAFQQLQESEKKHRTLVETIRDIVYTIDLEGRFTYISPMVEIVIGFSSNELIGEHFIEILSPGCRNKVIDSFKNNLKNKKPETLEVKIVTKNGVEVPMELNTTMLYDVHGSSIGRIGVARDITRRYEEEAKRKEMEIKALTQDKLASLGGIATGIAHEINQPLSYIKIILQSTLNDLSKEKLDTEELTEDFQESLRQVDKMSSIISHLRTFGRTDVTSFGPVKLTSVLNSALVLMKEKLRIKNISMAINISDTFPMLNGNHIKLEQVFFNLIQNSMDALEEQGKGEIKLSAKINNDHALIRFADTGEGVDPELQEKIFEPFFTMKEAGKGTGIGLSIVYGIIQEHQGTITCESEGEKGATFKIELPIYKDEKGDFVSGPLNA
jgi:PAS domain S-box-containing protein